MVDAVKIWMIRNQFARRNLTPFTRSELALKLEPLVSAQAKLRQSSAGGNHQKALPQKSAEAGETREKLAKSASVSHDTLAKAKVIIDQADEPRPLTKSSKAGNEPIKTQICILIRPMKTPEKLAQFQAGLMFRSPMAADYAERISKASELLLPGNNNSPGRPNKGIRKAGLTAN